VTEFDRRDHHPSEFRGVVADPVVVMLDPLDCRSCKDGKLGTLSEGRATCKKCGRVHGFIVLGGKVNYGVYL
jgi:hypothetical protein